MELTSPLTTLASISTPGSFYTAHGSPSNATNATNATFATNATNAADETTLSSPVADPPPEEPSFRDAVQLPHELRSHCQIHLEEQLYTAAIHILSGLLSDGTSLAKQSQKPARVPPPSQLALLTSLIVHPSFTSRPPEPGNLHAAAHAHAYLRGLLHTVGPLNANFRAAFDFAHTAAAASSSTTTTGATPPLLRHSARRGCRSRSNSHSHSNSDFGFGTVSGARTSHNNGNGNDSDDSSSSGGDSAALTGAFARSQLVFRRAADFWAVLGWAFRCAAEHPRRWRWWRVWLDFVVSVLEADFDERLARDKDKDHEERERDGEEGEGEGAGYGGGLAAGSLVVGYVEGLRRERRNALREVMRAVFAFSDAETAASDRKVFREVFEKETLFRVKSKRKRGEEAVVDLENDRFGDYLDGEDFEDEDDDDDDEDGQEGPTVPTPKGRRKPGRKPTAAKPTADTFTLTDAIAATVPFRLRIFRLLSAVSYYLPASPLCPVDELYETFTDHVRGLPLPLFRLFVESHPATLPEYVQVSLLRTLVDALLPPSSNNNRRPDPEAVDPEHGTGHGLTPLVMERCFLPYAAHRVTAEDNAKLALALESMLWYLFKEIGVEYSEGLRGAVEAGIRAREERINSSRRRGGGGGVGRKGLGAGDAKNAEEEAAREALARSARNLRALVDVIAVAGVPVT